jgi:hypothetical protein
MDFVELAEAIFSFSRIDAKVLSQVETEKVRSQVEE